MTERQGKEGKECIKVRDDQGRSGRVRFQMTVWIPGRRRGGKVRERDGATVEDAMHLSIASADVESSGPISCYHALQSRVKVACPSELLGLHQLDLHPGTYRGTESGWVECVQRGISTSAGVAGVIVKPRGGNARVEEKKRTSEAVDGAREALVVVSREPRTGPAAKSGAGRRPGDNRAREKPALVRRWEERARAGGGQARQG